MDIRHDQYYLALLHRIASNCRAIITYQVGLPLGCVRMQKMFIWLAPRRDLGFPVFTEYLNAVRPYAIGADRLHWNRKALFEQDQKLEEINRSFRDRIHNACHDILALLTAEGTAG
jgi:hypothetical protein